MTVGVGDLDIDLVFLWTVYDCHIYTYIKIKRLVRWRGNVKFIKQVILILSLMRFSN